VTVGCNKQSPPNKVDLSEHLDLPPIPQTQAGSAQTVLEKTFNLTTTASFAFEVPAHSAEPHLHGTFQSFVGKAEGSSDDSANVDFAVLNDEQQAQVANHQASHALFSVEATHNQVVNVDLPVATNQAAKYYLVFRNLPGNKASKVVQAQFRVDY
jgi:hypothetical protein